MQLGMQCCFRPRRRVPKKAPAPPHTTHSWPCNRAPASASRQCRVSWEGRQHAPLQPRLPHPSMSPSAHAGSQHKPGVVEAALWGQPSSTNSSALRPPREPTQDKTAEGPTYSLSDVHLYLHASGGCTPALSRNGARREERNITQWSREKTHQLQSQSLKPTSLLSKGLAFPKCGDMHWTRPRPIPGAPERNKSVLWGNCRAVSQPSLQTQVCMVMLTSACSSQARGGRPAPPHCRRASLLGPQSPLSAQVPLPTHVSSLPLQGREPLPSLPQMQIKKKKRQQNQQVQTQKSCKLSLNDKCWSIFPCVSCSTCHT